MGCKSRAVCYRIYFIHTTTGKQDAYIHFCQYIIQQLVQMPRKLA